jgi:hypothetical protein
MNLFESPVLRAVLVALSVLVVAALVYFIFIGARALFREARQTAREAGHQVGAATVRALARMSAWAAFFGLFYLLAFYLGKRLGWWAVPPVVAAFAAMIWCLMLADRLLTTPPGAGRHQAGIVATILSVLGLFAVGILFALRS